MAWRVKQHIPAVSKGRVAKVDGPTIYVTLGSESGISNGQELFVYRGAGEVKDPVTGEVLGSQRRRIARLVATETRERYCKAKLQGDLEIALQVGDEVEPTTVKNAIAVLPLLTPDGQETTQGNELSAEIKISLVESGLTVVERDQVAAVLSELLLQQTEFFDPEQAQNVGKQVGASVVLTGIIAQKGRSMSVRASLIEVETGKIKYASSLRVKATNLVPLGRGPRHVAPRSGGSAVVVGAGQVVEGVAAIHTVPVGNLGNVGELSGGGGAHLGPERVCGAVGYAYNIGKYPVTAGQYTEFLNDVATADAYALYNTTMWSDAYGCKIQRSGSSGSYIYSVASGMADRPVNHVSWGDAARFANWLHNGAQDNSITEDGAYFLNGAMSAAALMAVSRETDWKWAIPTEDEWYKAAYHKNNGATGDYFDYPTSSDSMDYSKANYYWSVRHTTDVGSYAYSSPYGTFDQGGNVFEWNETILDDGSMRGARGGSFTNAPSGLHASYRRKSDPTYEQHDMGFRVASSTSIPQAR